MEENKKLLLHACCCHCSAYTIKHWKELGYDITVFWYNPNIHPFTEHQERLVALRKMSEIQDFKLIEYDGYDIEDFFKLTAEKPKDRCYYCFTMRLSKAAEAATKLQNEFFSSTLLISPLQRHDLLELVGKEQNDKSNSTFLYEDLRKHYSESRRITKPLGLYTQQYCGCVLSEWERYRDYPPKDRAELYASVDPARRYLCD